ncbi:DUF3306 domain-containing protein [Mesorhizobium sp. 1B3]|uniref:DUF3306 domain-containing protein n=1 Tax=Mesorhizobium sp. 1B3 TaxID=3243599 RepID=UPI003D963DB5
MSAGNENLFARWSRRKQAARSTEFQTPDEEAHALDKPTAQAKADSIDQQLAPAEPDTTEAETVEPIESLPRVEDLTVDSDLSVFLRKGVPKALKGAAMRKMWSLDPAIRDYVGPAEYAWDFNQPGSMAGFGSLDPNDAVVDFLSTIGRALDADAGEKATAPGAPQAQSARAPADLSEQQADTPPDDTDHPASSDVPPEPRQLSASSQSPTSDPFETVVSQEGTAEPEQLSQPTARPRHGSALPR